MPTCWVTRTTRTGAGAGTHSRGTPCVGSYWQIHKHKATKIKRRAYARAAPWRERRSEGSAVVEANTGSHRAGLGLKLKRHCLSSVRTSLPGASQPRASRVSHGPQILFWARITARNPVRRLRLSTPREDALVGVAMWRLAASSGSGKHTHMTKFSNKRARPTM